MSTKHWNSRGRTNSKKNSTGDTPQPSADWRRLLCNVSVLGKIDYEKLVRDFGSTKISPELLEPCSAHEPGFLVRVHVALDCESVSAF